MISYSHALSSRFPRLLSALRGSAVPALAVFAVFAFSFSSASAASTAPGGVAHAATVAAGALPASTASLSANRLGVKASLSLAATSRKSGVVSVTVRGRLRLSRLGQLTILSCVNTSCSGRTTRDALHLINRGNHHLNLGCTLASTVAVRVQLVSRKFHRSVSNVANIFVRDKCYVCRSDQ